MVIPARPHCVQGKQLMSRVLSNELARLDSRDSHPSFVVLLHSFMCGHIVTSEDWFCCAESALCFAQTSPERLVMVVAMLRLLRENKQSVYLIICHSC